MKRILCAMYFSLVGWQALAGELEDVYKHASEVVKSAKTAADLDAVYDELDSVINRNAPTQDSPARVPQSGTSQPMTVGKLDEARLFVAKWQDCLAAKAGGYDDEARSIAKDLASYSTPLLPRSEILAKAYEPKSLSEKQTKAELPIEKIPEPSGPVIINLDQEGRVSIGKASPMTLVEMKDALERLKATNPNLSLIIRAKTNVRYEKLQNALEMIGSTGISNVAFTRGTPASGPTPAPQPPPAK